MTSSHPPAVPPAGKPSRLARVRRKPCRARYDTPAVHAVLDAAPLCHVATIRSGQPVVLPMAQKQPGSPGAAMAWEVPDRTEDHSPQGRCVRGRDLRDAAGLGGARVEVRQERTAGMAL